MISASSASDRTVAAVNSAVAPPSTVTTRAETGTQFAVEPPGDRRQALTIRGAADIATGASGRSGIGERLLGEYNGSGGGSSGRLCADSALTGIYTQSG